MDTRPSSPASFASARHWAILQHCAPEGPGLIAHELAARRLAFAVYRLDCGAALPALRELDGLVVMGGPMGVYEADRYPFLRREMDLMAAAVSRGLPVLGICLGAQLLAAALGASVVRGPVAEIGAGEVTLTPAGANDPVLAGADGAALLPVIHWHQDTFDLPPGAQLLASSAIYPHQAFHVGPSVYGLQFHLELDADLAAAWAPELPPERQLPAAHLARVTAAGRSVIARYFDRVAAATGPTASAGGAL